MRDLSTLTFHPTAEKIVEIICQKTQNTNPTFFRIVLSYYLARMAAMMRVSIATKDRGIIPANLYAINLAGSGEGKGYSTNFIEMNVIQRFNEVFEDQTFPVVSDENVAKAAIKRANIENVDPDDMLMRVTKEFKDLGKYASCFNSATTAAVQQMRNKLLLAGIGAVNFEMDEIGSNLLGNADVLSSFLELFDLGITKQKLTKNTKENLRVHEVKGITPTNMLLFGTHTALLNGGKVEEEFMSFLKTGYARRCFFGFARELCKDMTLTPEQVYDISTNQQSNQFIDDISIAFSELANIVNYKKVITVSKDVSILLIEYRLHCEKLAYALSEYDDIEKAELSHRYFKVLKLAGVYAFIDGQAEITEDNLYHAICMAEESGKSFNQIHTREPNYAKLAKYIAGTRHELTHVDLMEKLAFYKGSAVARTELMTNAMTWGYKNQVIIKRSTSSNIEFFKGETLKATDLDNLILSISDDISDGYENKTIAFNKLHIFSQLPFTHWTNHHTSNGHRDDECMLPGFNMLVLDIDDGTYIQTFDALMKDYKYLLHTTKRHTSADHRFRVIMPINYQLFLDRNDFKEFMNNVFEWLPVEIVVDEKTGQRSRKWVTCQGNYKYSTGTKLIDVMQFIPKTSKNDERKKSIQTYQSLSNLERWFVQNSDGNRNNQLIRYALMLVDSGYTLGNVQQCVTELNNKLADKLPEKEINDTIMQTVSKKIREAA